MKVAPIYTSSNNMNKTCSTSFGIKTNQRCITNIAEKATDAVLPCAIIGASGVVASFASGIKFLQKFCEPKMPTRENILSELEAPMVVNGMQVFNPKEPDKQIDTAILDEIINDKDVAKATLDGQYNDIFIKKYGADSYRITFSSPSKESETREARYSIRANKDGEIMTVSKSIDIYFNDDKTFEKRMFVSPKLAEVSYQAGEDEFSLKYDTDESGNIIVSKYHNGLANDLPMLNQRSYDGDINDCAMKKFFKKIYQ